MMFEAILFLAGAVLFFLAVVFFVFLWQDRTRLAERHNTLETENAALKEKHAELDIWERELQVWNLNLETEQAAIAQAKEELRMLTTSSSQDEQDQDRHVTAGRPSGRSGAVPEHRRPTAAKNQKLDWDDVKLRR